MAESRKNVSIQDDPLDNMEGLCNQSAFYEKVQQNLRAGSEAWYMLACAIEDFPLITELYGREIGRDILVRTAEMLLRHIEDGDVIGRIRRDEFIVLVRGDHFSEKNVLRVLKEFQDEASPYNIFLHIGIYEITDPAASVVAICNRASIALDHIASEDGNCLSYYSDALVDNANQKRKVIREVEDALDKEHFQIFLQPQVAPDGTLTGAESLVRWNHPEDGILPPGKFVGILEEAGLIYLIDRYVWELAASQLEDWRDTKKGRLTLSVNISQKDFYYLDIYTIFTELVQQYGISPDRLKLEITEDAFLIGANRHMIRRLKDSGFRIEIDRFGTGPSSLRMLKDVEADAIKIDREFVRELEERERSRIVLDSIIDMCKRLDISVIAEGIENEYQLNYLRERGCDAFQGYYFDKPMPVDAFEQKYFQ